MKEEIAGKTAKKILKEYGGSEDNYKNSNTEPKDVEDISSVSGTSIEVVSDTSSRS